MKAAISLIAFAALACAQATASPLEVRLRPNVQVTEGMLQLGDVAVLECSDLDTLRFAMALPVARAPRPGSELVLQRERIAGRLAAQLGAATAITWRGVDEVLVQARAEASKPVIVAVPVEPTVIVAAKPAPVAAPAAVPVTAQAPAVTRGQEVTLVSRAGGLELRARAHALGEARVGQIVQVRASASAQPVEAVAVAPGQVELKP